MGGKGRDIQRCTQATLNDSTPISTRAAAFTLRISAREI
jgi:hypothetical protein